MADRSLPVDEKGTTDQNDSSTPGVQSGAGIFVFCFDGGSGSVKQERIEQEAQSRKGKYEERQQDAARSKPDEVSLKGETRAMLHEKSRKNRQARQKQSGQGSWINARRHCKTSRYGIVSSNGQS